MSRRRLALRALGLLVGVGWGLGLSSTIPMPAGTVAGVVGLIARCGAAYVGVIALATLVACTIRPAPAHQRVIVALTPGPLRRLLPVALCTTVVLASSPIPVSAAEPSPLRLDDTAATVAPPETMSRETATFRLVVPGSTPPPEPATPAIAPPARAVSHHGGADVWRVVAGDHLWHIAVVTLTARTGEAPDAAAAAAYLEQLTLANRDRLVDPQNPDLIYPGQVVTLP